MERNIKFSIKKDENENKEENIQNDVDVDLVDLKGNVIGTLHGTKNDPLHANYNEAMERIENVSDDDVFDFLKSTKSKMIDFKSKNKKIRF